MNKMAVLFSSMVKSIFNVRINPDNPEGALRIRHPTGKIVIPFFK